MTLDKFFQQNKCNKLERLAIIERLKVIRLCDKIEKLAFYVERIIKTR